MTTSEAMRLLGGLVLEDGRPWALAATSWQVVDAEAVLDAGEPRQHLLTRPRGGSKTTDLAGFVLAALLTQLPPASRCYWVAADRDQGRLGVDALAGLVARSDLSHMVKVDQWKATVAANGSTLEVLAADAPGAHGLKSPLVVVDEAAQWPGDHQHRGVWEAVASGMDKVPGSRLVVLTTAGDPSSWFAKVHRHAVRSPAWRVSEVPGPLPWRSAEFLADQRALLPDSVFARLHLNRWSEAEDRLVGVEDLRRAVRLDGPQPYVPGHRYVVGLDLGVTNDRCVAAVCHAESEPNGRRRVVLDHLRVWAGSRRRPVDLSEVEETVAALSAAYGGGGARRASVRADPWQAIGMLQRLRSRRVPVQEWSFTPQRYATMAQTLLVLLRNGLLWLPDDERLLDELGSVRLKPTGSTGLLRVDHDAGAHDDQVVALAFAATAVLEQGRVRHPLTATQLEAQRNAIRSLRPMTAGLFERAL